MTSRCMKTRKNYAQIPENRPFTEVNWHENEALKLHGGFCFSIINMYNYLSNRYIAIVLRFINQRLTVDS